MRVFSGWMTFEVITEIKIPRVFVYLVSLRSLCDWCSISGPIRVRRETISVVSWSQCTV
jgi:hypothetical protein